MNIEFNLESNKNTGFYALYASLRFFKEFNADSHAEPNLVKAAYSECHLMLESLRFRHPKEYAEAYDKYNFAYKNIIFPTLPLKKGNYLDGYEKKICGYCNLKRTPEGYDGCIGELKNVKNACCGHGEEKCAYVQFNHEDYDNFPNKKRIAGKKALEYIKANSVNNISVSFVEITGEINKDDILKNLK